MPHTSISYSDILVHSIMDEFINELVNPVQTEFENYNSNILPDNFTVICPSFGINFEVEKSIV